jgi:hypothetical protein
MGEEVAGGFEDAPKHLPGQLARERVLLARVVAPEEDLAAGKARERPVTEDRGRDRGRQGERPAGPQVRLPADPAQPDHDPDAGEQSEFFQEVRRAVGDLRRQWLVSRGRTPNRGGHVRVGEPEPVLGMLGRRLAGEPGLPEGAEEPVAALVPREDAAGPVAAMRRGRETDQEQSSPGVAETRERAGPVPLARVTTWRRRADRFAVRDEAWAETTAHDPCVEARELSLALRETPIV